HVTCAFGEDVDDDVEEVEEEPLAFSLAPEGRIPSLAEQLVDAISNGSAVSIARAGHQDQEISVINLAHDVDDLNPEGLLVHSRSGGQESHLAALLDAGLG